MEKQPSTPTVTNMNMIMEFEDAGLPTGGSEAASLFNGSSATVTEDDDECDDNLLLENQQQDDRSSYCAIEANTVNEDEYDAEDNSATYIEIASATQQASANEASHEQLPLISREGLRKSRSHQHYMGQADRLRKSGD